MTLARFRYLTAALFLAALQPSASAENYTRDGAIGTALRNNRDLGVAMLEIDRAGSRLRWAGRLANPELEFSTATDQFGLDEEEGLFQFAFAQRFPLTARLRNEKIVRRQDLGLARIEFEMRQRQLAFEVDKAWIALHAAQRTEELQSRLLQLNSEISSFLSERVSLGEVSSLDANQAALGGKLLEQQLGVAGADVSVARARLQKLLGVDPATEIALSGAPALPPSVPPTSIDLETVLARRPDYTYFLVSGELGLAQLALARSQRWDDISLKLFAEREAANDEPAGLERNNFVGLGISIPLPLFNKNEAAIEEAQIDIERARRQQLAKSFDIQSELTTVLEARRAAYQIVTSVSSEAIPLAQENFRQFKTAQQNGQATLLQVQQAQEQLLQLETSALALRKNYHDLDAEIRFIAGVYPVLPPPVLHRK